MQMNADKGSHIKYAMVQLPEICDEEGTAYKAGFSTICEIGKERIRRAGDKIKSESPMTTQDLDIGFRVLKLDDTNMKDVYYAPDDYDQNMLAGLESNIKDDRTDLDLLFGCLINWGLPLSLPYKSEQIDGCTVHTYNDGDLIACFDANIPESVVKDAYIALDQLNRTDSNWIPLLAAPLIVNGAFSIELTLKAILTKKSN